MSDDIDRTAEYLELFGAEAGNGFTDHIPPPPEPPDDDGTNVPPTEEDAGTNAPPGDDGPPVYADHILTRSALHNLPDPEPLIDNVLDQGTTALLYGRWGTCQIVHRARLGRVGGHRPQWQARTTAAAPRALRRR